MNLGLEAHTFPAAPPLGGLEAHTCPCTFQCTRGALQPAAAPDLTAFEPDDPGDLTAFEPDDPGDVTEFELID